MKAKDVRKGTVIIYQNAPHRVVDFQHRTPGNLRAFVQVKLRNLFNSILTETRFSSTDDLEEADIFSYRAQFLYADDLGYHFMNVENYEQVVLTKEEMGTSQLYLTDSLLVDIMTFDDKPIALQLPKTVELQVLDCPPEIKGASATNSGKLAVTTTGLSVTVPPFIAIGENIIVNTDDGSYLGRGEK